MDSASGSLQSSSGGDEEYDSRAADSVSAFMSGGPISNPPPAPQPPFFDPLSNYLQLHQNPNSSLLNSTLSWPKSSLRSDPNPISHDNNIINSMLPTSSSYMPPFQTPPPPGVDNTSSPTTLAPPPLNQNPAAARNPKKRSRASRRAPTTVLTTDTSNFRAMVQEFTGIPAPPFSNSSFPRSRLDLFGTRSASLDAAGPPPYLRRPFPQKVQPPHSLLSSAALDAITASSPNNNINPHANVSSTTTTAAASSSTPSINYQLPITQNSNLFNIQNPLLTSLLQSNSKFPFSTSPVIGSKPFEIPSNINHPHAKIGGLDQQFGLGHGNNLSETLTGLPNLINSDQIAPRNDQNDSSAARWSENPVGGGGGVVGDGERDEGVNLRQVNGNYSFPINSKVSFSASSTSSFHGGKAPENVAARGEGMVESWICSSE